MAAIKIELDTLEQLTEKVEQIVKKAENVEAKLGEPKFYTIAEVAKMLKWSQKLVQDLFNRKDFPSCDFGKGKIVEANALRQYFSIPRRR